MQHVIPVLAHPGYKLSHVVLLAERENILTGWFRKQRTFLQLLSFTHLNTEVMQEIAAYMCSVCFDVLFCGKQL
jgi:hypothetical protein